jgi:hypothetical protein
VAIPTLRIPIQTTDSFSATFGKLNRALGGAAVGVDKLKSHTQGLRTMFGALGRLGGLGGIGAMLGGGLSIAGISNLTKGVAEYGESIGRAANLTGMGVEEIQRLTAAARMCDIPAEDLQGSLFKFARAVGAAANPASQQAKLFSALGVKTKDAAGKIRPMDEILLDCADAFKKLDSPATRAQVLVGLFGKSGARMGELLRKGASGIKELEAAAKNVLTPEDTRRATEFADKLKMVTMQFEGIRNKAGIALLPGIGKILGTLGDLMDKNSAKIAAFFTKLGNALPGVLSKIGKAFHTLYPLVSKTLHFLGGLIDKVGPGNAVLIALGAVVLTQVLPPLIAVSGVLKGLMLFTMANPLTLAIVGLGAALLVTGGHFAGLIAYYEKWKNLTAVGKIQTAEASKREIVGSLAGLYAQDVKATGGKPTFASPAIKELEQRLTGMGIELPTDLLERSNYLNTLNKQLNPSYVFDKGKMTGGLAPLQKAEITLKIKDAKGRIAVEGIKGDANIAGVEFEDYDMDMGPSLVTP